MKKITKTRALEIYSTIYPKDDMREVPPEYPDRCRRNNIAVEVQEVCAEPTFEKAVDVVDWWIIKGANAEECADLRKAVKRMRAMGRAKR